MERINLMDYKSVAGFFFEKGYVCLKPYPIVNNNDTLFVSAGIQPILKDFRAGLLEDQNKVFVSQPVIRTQYVDSVDEGSSVAFINPTTSSFNLSEEKYINMVKEWYEFFDLIGLSKNKMTTVSDYYEDEWGDLKVSGNRTFHYYDGVEIGDTTFFTKVEGSQDNIGIDSMSDLGFGLERLRWISGNHSYFDLYRDSSSLDSQTKAYLSAIALLTVNGVKPSNKNIGYRSRLLSKRIATSLQGRDLNDNENQYLDECLRYWMEWQVVDSDVDKSVIIEELVRNGNRFIIDSLAQEGYQNLLGININISRDELQKRLVSSGVPSEKVKQYIRR